MALRPAVGEGGYDEGPGEEPNGRLRLFVVGKQSGLENLAHRPGLLRASFSWQAHADLRRGSSGSS
jgi:hypothetical protein